MLSRFPKTRPPLPEAFARIYAAQYRENRRGESPASRLSQRMESWLHRQVARDVRAAASGRATLEIGAGTLNHLPYEPGVEPYDVVEPFTALYEGSPWLRRVRRLYADVRAVPASARYARITSIAAFEHICNLPEVIARAGLLLEPGGTLRVSIPSEGTLVWALGWKLTTGLEFRLRHGLDYGVLMKHEHVNTAAEIETLLHHFFETVGLSVFGLSRRLSLYRFYRCADPRPERCRAYLATLE
jgi:hypothetical protein